MVKKTLIALSIMLAAAGCVAPVTPTPTPTPTVSSEAPVTRPVDSMTLVAIRVQTSGPSVEYKVKYPDGTTETNVLHEKTVVDDTFGLIPGESVRIDINTKIGPTEDLKKLPDYSCKIVKYLPGEDGDGDYFETFPMLSQATSKDGKTATCYWENLGSK